MKFAVKGEMRSVTVGTNAGFMKGHVALKAFKSNSDLQLKLGDVGDFEKTNAWSYGAWVWIENRESVGGLIARMDEKNDFRGWDLFLDKDKPVAHFVNKWPDNAVRVASKTKLEPKKWSHIFVTYDGSAKPTGVRIFINGKLAEMESDTKNLTETIRTTAPLTIAHRHGGGTTKNVAIQDVRIYERQLRAGGSRAHWRMARGRPGWRRKRSGRRRRTMSFIRRGWRRWTGRS